MADDITEPWREMMGEFEAHLIGSNKSPRTVEVRLLYVGRFAKGRTDTPADVEPRHVIRFLGRSGWKPSTRAVAQAGLKSFFGWAKAVNIIPTDPTAALTPVKQTRAVAAEAATRAQINAAVKGAKDARVRLMVRLMADAGLSALEISQARPRDVFERGGDAYLRVFGRANVEREVFLLEDLAKEIRAFDSDWIFPGRFNGHISPAYVVRLVSQTLPKGVTSEDVRAAYKTGGGGDSQRGWREGQPYHSPDALGFMENPDLADSLAMAQQIKRIARDIDRDPAAAIGACKEFLETLFKAVLDAKGVPYGQGRFESFPALFDLVSGALDLPTRSVPENVDASRGVGNLTDGLWLAASGIGTIRNKVGTGHGHESSPAERRHSRLVFNCTVALAEFISDTWRTENPD